MSQHALRTRCCLFFTKNVPPSLEIRDSVNMGASFLSAQFAALAALQGEHPASQRSAGSPTEMAGLYFHLRARWVFSEHGFTSQSLVFITNAEYRHRGFRLASPGVPPSMGAPGEPRNSGAHTGVWSVHPLFEPHPGPAVSVHEGFF